MANLLSLKDGFNLDTNVGAQNLHIFTLLSMSPRNSFTFIFVLISLIIDLIMTLSERRNVVNFLDFKTKIVFNILNFSTLSQFF